jgi:cyanophycinase-like exopeptidase
MYVTTPAGEREVFTTKDEEFAQRVAKMVREGIPVAPTSAPAPV